MGESLKVDGAEAVDYEAKIKEYQDQLMALIASRPSLAKFQSEIEAALEKIPTLDERMSFLFSAISDRFDDMARLSKQAMERVDVIKEAAVRIPKGEGN
ncbi:MAG: hypothetical protein PVG39_25065 [Desulfobacteraceae bacterium]|jgi:hypothetical protein